MARVNRDAAAQVVKLLDVRPDNKVLEIGFGPGVGVQLLLERVTSGWVAGVDLLARDGQTGGRPQCQRTAQPPGGLRYGSVEKLPFADATFDKALAINSMQVWPDARTGLQEIRRVLKPGGTVALCCTVNSGQSKDGIAETLAMAEFAHARIVDQATLFCAIATKP
jgi:ubiquinone/menaquinone biosynthesis C-methylase UbiE